MQSNNMKSLLSLSLREQERWIKSQAWFSEENLITKLQDAPVIAMSVDIEDDLDERIDNFEDYNNAGFLASGLISKQRFEELENGASFKEEDRGKLREYLIADEIADHLILEARWIDITINDKNLGAVYTVNSHPLAGFVPAFFGIFETEDQVEKKMSKYGTLIDNFLD